MSDNNLALPHIKNLQKYIPGKPIETLAREKNLSKIIKLGSNENPFGASPLVAKAINESLTTIQLYPDPDCYLLKTSLSELYDLSNNMLVIGNGSDELIRLIMQTFVDSHNDVIAPRYSFFSYLIATQGVNAQYIVAEINDDWQNNLDNVLAKINDHTKIICFANPNNPTGTCLNEQAIQDFMLKVPAHILVLLDEAYFEYLKYSAAEQYYDYSINLVKKHHNLILLRTFSKAYGLAGLRVGYAISHPDIIAAINKIRLPFNVNKIAQVAAVTALQDQDFVKKTVQMNTIQKELLYKAFADLKIKYISSMANFVTIYCSKSQLLYNQLLDHGIIVRPIDNYGLINYLRITVGSPEENEYLIKTLININAKENLWA